MGRNAKRPPVLPFDIQIGQGGEDDEEKEAKKKRREEVLNSIKEFNMTPRDVKAQLDRYVIEQDEAKKVLSVAMCDHYNWARRCLNDETLRESNYTKPNILILGPTGSGKTYLVRTLAKLLGVPFAKADATKFSETGIVGQDPEDVLKSLSDAASGDIELAQYGIVYIDEVDKITAAGSTAGGLYSGRQVQSSFLKIMEDSEISMKKSPIEMMLSSSPDTVISTKFILFIFSGAFNNLNDIVKKRVGAGSMGFAVEGDPAHSEDDMNRGTPASENLLQSATTEDFIEAGLEPEFIGRIPVRIAIAPLTSHDLFRIMTDAEDSVVDQCVKEFEGYGITLKPTADGLKRVAELAAVEKTGARALVTVLERMLRNFKFELPSSAAKELELTRELVDDPQRTLGAMLCSPESVVADIEKWIAEIEVTHKIQISLASDLKDIVAKECTSMKQSARDVLSRRLFATGVIETLAEISRRTAGSATNFMVTLAMYENPSEEMEKYKMHASLLEDKAED